MRTIGDRLKEARKSLGLNQDQFCELVNVSRKTQSDYENGRGYPDALYLSILQKQGIDIGYIVTGEKTASLDDLVELQKCIGEVEDWLKANNKKLQKDQLLNAAKQLFKAKQEQLPVTKAIDLILNTATGT